jgi:hypothetical protein
VRFIVTSAVDKGVAGVGRLRVDEPPEIAGVPQKGDWLDRELCEGLDGNATPAYWSANYHRSSKAPSRLTGWYTSNVCLCF